VREGCFVPLCPLPSTFFSHPPYFFVALLFYVYFIVINLKFFIMTTLIIIVVTILLTKYGMFNTKQMADDVKLFSNELKSIRHGKDDKDKS
jgi:hypothetical protein